MLFFLRKVSNRRGKLFHIIFSEVQILHGCISLCVHSQRGNLGTCFIEDTCLSIRMHDILTGKQSIHCTLKDRIALRHFPCFFIFLYQMDRTSDTLIRHILCDSFPKHKFYAIRLGIDQIPGRDRNLFQIYGILCLCDHQAGSAIAVSGRHLGDQLRTVFVTVNAIYGTCKPVSCLAVLFYDLNGCHLHPAYFEIHIFFIIHALAKYKSQVLCAGSGGDLISTEILGDASLHRSAPGILYILCLCQRCGKIKLCTAAYFHTCARRTGLSGGYVMEFDAIWQFHGDRLQFIRIKCDLFCPL